MEKLLELKKKIKEKMPKFKRADAHKKDKLKRTGWKKPKGLHNKMRLQKRGYRKIVKSGYRTPQKTRGLDKKGRTLVYVSTKKELEHVKKDEVIIINSSVGTKKRLEILDDAEKKGLAVKNYKDAKEYSKKAVEKLKERRKLQQLKIEQRQKKKQIAEKKKEKEVKKDIEEKVDKEEKKKQDKKEKDKILTKKE